MTKFKCEFCGNTQEGEIIIGYSAGNAKHEKVANQIVCDKCLNYIHQKRGVIK